MRAILTYHSIDDSGSPISITREAFQRHMRWLAGGGGGVRVVRLEELGALPPETDAVALTFDDGFANFGVEAAPILQDHGLPATLFVVTDHVGRTNAWNGREEAGVPVLPLLDWGALCRLTELGGVTLGGHTRRHPHLPALRGALLLEEIAGAAERLRAETGASPRTFAYPYGDRNGEVVRVVADYYQLACTTDLRMLDPVEDPMRLPRLDAYYFREPGQLEKWGTSSFRLRLRVRAEARRVRQAFRVVSGSH